ncbi:MAG TPA: ABC transporter permease subunit [Acidobacteriota bacterium]|nr:ABC transporter permease subunit [Acidobacteriota bacterium]
MLREIVFKEVRDQLMSLRLQLAFVLVIILMVGNALLFQADYKRQLSDYSVEVNRNLAELARRASLPGPLFETFSFSNQFIFRRPNPLGFVTEGHDKDLPNAFQVNAFRLTAPEFTLRGNPSLWRFENLDWTLIVSLVFGFAAIVLVYDSVSGEKERGTLRLVMANSVPKEKVLLGKYLSALFVLFIPLITGVLLSLIVFAIGSVIPINAGLLGRIGISLLLCLIYISSFVLLALFLSTRSRVPAISLVSGLLIWVILLVVVPAAGNLLARGLLKLPMEDQVLEEADRAFGEAVENYNRLNPHPDNWIMSGKWSPGEPLLRAFEAERAWNRVYQAYQDRLIAQVRLGKRIAGISPAALLGQTLEGINESGVNHYESFLRSARQYREELGNFLDSKYPLKKVYPLDRNATDRIVVNMHLDFGSIPKFEDRFLPMKEAAGQSLWSAAAMVLMNLLLFGAAYFSFLRYDVR